MSARLLRILRESLRRQAGTAGEEDDAAGFTLIEMMVVLLIMAILLAIAIPTFLGVKASAQDRSTQSDLANAVTSAMAFYGTAQNYGSSPAIIEAALQSSDPAFVFSTAAVSGSRDITLSTGPDGQTLIMGEQSANGRCWYLEVNQESSVSTGGNTNGNQSGTRGFTYAATPIGETHDACASTGSSVNGGDGGPNGLTWSPAFPR